MALVLICIVVLFILCQSVKIVPDVYEALVCRRQQVRNRRRGRRGRGDTRRERMEKGKGASRYDVRIGGGRGVMEMRT